jgi:tetratricopeptide (TPR) repeat protein
MSRKHASVRRLIVGVVALLGLVLAARTAHGQTPDVKKYPFAKPPLEIYDRLSLSGVGKAESLPEGDRKFLIELWSARTAKPAKEIPPADEAAVIAHLIASGVSDVKVRAAYLKRFNELVAEAQKVTAGAKSDSEKADLLLRFLHKGVMASGYEAEQTTLSTLFDTGKYNCVSSASLYFLVGTRVGLKLRSIIIPGTGFSAGHAAVDLVDGTKRIEVEPTNPDGFDWPAKLRQPGVIVIGSLPDRKEGYDSDGFGLACSAASNLGIAAAKADPSRPIEAIRWQVVALVLDPTDPSAATSLLAAVSNWGLKLDEVKKYEEALRVYEFGSAALGAHEILDGNYNAVWYHYLDWVFGEGRLGDGLKLLPRAAAAFPMDKTIADPATWVSRAARRKAESDGWAAGLAFADSALKDLTGDVAKSVRAWKDKARRQWSEELLDKGDLDGSLKVIAAGLTETPDSEELLAGLSLHTKESLDYLSSKKDPAAAITHFKEICQKFPKIKDVTDRGYNHAEQEVVKLTGEKKFAEALKAAAVYEPLAGDRAGEIKCNAFDLWATALATEGKWEAAIGKYIDGLAAFPHSKLLRENAIATVDQWAHEAIEKKDWAAAIGRYDAGLKHFSDDKFLKNKREYYQSRLDKKQ